MIRALEIKKIDDIHIPGSYLEGNLICSFGKNDFVKVMKIRFVGSEFANVKIPFETLFNMDNVVCHAETVLLDNISVVKGTNSYGFRVQIPRHIPSSYTNEYGGIRYFLEGDVMLKNSTIKKSTKNIAIFSPVDLKTFNAKLWETETFSSETELVNICGIGGVIFSNVMVDKRIFACGESIDLHVTVKNSSGSPVNKIQAYLMKSNSCRLPDGEYALGKHRVITKYKCTAQVGNNEEKTYLLSIVVPDDLSIPNLKNSKFFKTKHWIHVSISFSHFWRRSIRTIFKVYLGHIPVKI